MLKRLEAVSTRERIKFYRGPSGSSIPLKRELIFQLIEMLKPISGSQKLIEYLPELLKWKGDRKIDGLQILIPGKALLNKMASYYREKYEIDIQICNYFYGSNDLQEKLWSCPYKSGPPKRPVLFLLDTVLATAS